MGTKTPQTICVFLIMALMIHNSIQNVQDNKIEEEASPFLDMASSLLNNKNSGNLAAVGGILNTLMQSEEGKNLGGMLMNGLNNNAGTTNDILAGIGQVLSNGQGNFDPSVFGNVIEMFSDTNNENEIPGSKQSDDNPNFGNLLGNIIGGFAGQKDFNTESLLTFLPMMMSTLDSFTNEEAAERAKQHSSHSWMLPPFIEQLHLLWDHFQHSELGKNMFKKFGLTKLIKVFTNEQGRFDFDKIVTMIENHSFRRHWLSIGTNRLADMVGVFADPTMHKKYFTTAQMLVNGFLKERGFPKAALFDPNRAGDSISAMVNVFLKKILKVKFESAPYVKPIVKYVEDLVRTAQERSMKFKSGIDSREISNKLTDTINLEVIEPVLRVSRAYRYAKKVPTCDRYVMCLINQEDPNSTVNLPKLKQLLSRSCSIFASWFLSSHTKTPFLSLYAAIIEESNCQQRYPVDCSDFHAEEIRVTTEYIHNEL